MSDQCAMPLAELLAGLAPVSAQHNRDITGLTVDSRAVKPGDVFCAYQGATQHGCQFIPQAIAAGAAAILIDSQPGSQLVQGDQPQLKQTFPDVPMIKVSQLQQKVGVIAAKLYPAPAQHMDIIGITGTNGKTTSCYYITSLLAALGVPCGLSGTLGIGTLQNMRYTGLTTQDHAMAHKSLRNFFQAHINTVAMEVSSHGLDQHRLAGVEFKVALFTNLTRDHIDYHGSLADYAKVKAKLFAWPTLKTVVVNVDDPYAELMLAQVQPGVEQLGYSLCEDAHSQSSLPLIRAKNIHLKQGKIRADLHTPWGTAVVNFSPLGRFNLANCIAAIAVVVSLGHDFTDVVQAVTQLVDPPGRMERFTVAGQPMVVVDFAHTPDALEKALLALKAYCTGRLWCVFGCGGDRDRGKRSMMGTVVSQAQAQIVITNDNPRHEDPQRIVDDIMQGIDNKQSAHIEYDRKKAIRYAIAQARAEDIVLVAGKGHESVQIIGDTRKPLSDREYVKTVLQESLAC